MKYLAVLGFLFLAGCTAVSDSRPLMGHGSYRDYSYTKNDGQVMVHRVYTSGHQEWLTQAEAAAKAAR